MSCDHEQRKKFKQNANTNLIGTAILSAQHPVEDMRTKRLQKPFVPILPVKTLHQTERGHSDGRAGKRGQKHSKCAGPPGGGKGQKTSAIPGPGRWSAGRAGNFERDKRQRPLAIHLQVRWRMEPDRTVGVPAGPGADRPSLIAAAMMPVPQCRWVTVVVTVPGSLSHCVQSPSRLRLVNEPLS